MRGFDMMVVNRGETNMTEQSLAECVLVLHGQCRFRYVAYSHITMLPLAMFSKPYDALQCQSEQRQCRECNSHGETFQRIRRRCYSP